MSNLGVLYYYCPSIAEVDDIALKRFYKNRDEITVSPEKMGAVYEDKVKMFFDEHLHEDEEIRYILDGEGFFDVRSANDDWLVVSILLPPYFRFESSEFGRNSAIVACAVTRHLSTKVGLTLENGCRVRIKLEKSDLLVLPAGKDHLIQP